MIACLNIVHIYKKTSKNERGPSGSFEIDVQEYKISLGIHNGELQCYLTKYDEEGNDEYSSGI